VNHPLALTDAEARIAERIKPDEAKRIAISDAAGGVAFADMAQVMEFARYMAVGNISVPQHLRGNPGACLAVCVQAIEWRMSPFAVANKSYSVNNRLAFESQLIQAVILQRAPIKGRFKVEYRGENGKRRCKVTATLADGTGAVEYETPEFDKIQPKNSPLWKTDPDQQQFYYAGRALCRRHFPDVLLGVYDRDELVAEPIQPGPRGGTASQLADRLDEIAAGANTIENDVGDAAEQATAGEDDQRPAEKVETDPLLAVAGSPPEGETDSDDDTSPRGELMARLRSAAMQGSRRLKFALGKLSVEEQALVTDEDRAALTKAAESAA
jgi:hypothetical protein